MRYVSIILPLLLLSVPTYLRANQNRPDILAEKFLIVTKQKEQNVKLLEMLKTQTSRQMNRYAQVENLDEKQKKLFKTYINKMTTILIEELAWGKIKANHLNIIKTIYTDDELRSLISFFESELGQLYINKQQIAVQMLGDSSQKSVQNVMRRIRKMEQEMKAELRK